MSCSNNGSWVPVAGHASVVDHVDRLRELWVTFTAKRLEGDHERVEL